MGVLRRGSLPLALLSLGNGLMQGQINGRRDGEEGWRTDPNNPANKPASEAPAGPPAQSAKQSLPYDLHAQLKLGSLAPTTPYSPPPSQSTAMSPSVANSPASEATLGSPLVSPATPAPDKLNAGNVPISTTGTAVPSWPTPPYARQPPGTGQDQLPQKGWDAKSLLEHIMDPSGVAKGNSLKDALFQSLISGVISPGSHTAPLQSSLFQYAVRQLLGSSRKR